MSHRPQCNFGSHLSLLSSMSVIAELIGPNLEGAAFVYGLMSLVSKLSNGLIIMCVQSLAPHNSKKEIEGGVDSPFYTHIMFFACGGGALVGAVAMLTMVPFTIGRRYCKAQLTER